MIPLPPQALGTRDPLTFETFKAICDAAASAKDVKDAVAAGAGIVTTARGGLGADESAADGFPKFTAGAVAVAALASGDIPNNAANTTGSAAKWTTARTLAGNSVDGSANVAFANKLIVQGTTDAGLSAAQFLGALGTGLLKNTTTTGVLSIATSADIPSAVLFVATNDQVTTANTLTSLFGAGIGSRTLPANFLIAGSTIKVSLGGYNSVADGAGGTKTFEVQLGGVVVATGASGAVITTVVNKAWTAEAFITCRSTGAGGTVIGGGKWMTTIADGRMYGVNIASLTTAACDTTNTNLVDVLYNNGNATGTATCTWALIEKVA